MNALVKVDIPSLAMSEPELLKVLEGSIYPGAAVESIKLVVGYCRAQHLDPILKPVHIVPMDVKVKLPQKVDGKDFRYEKRDVVMPGIGLYRIQAARTGEYAGVSEPEFGPTKEMKLRQTYRETEDGPDLEREFSFEYPEWCRMTVRRIVGGHIVDFAAVEYWLENYATKGRGTKLPNAMWEKRPRGQIAKCTEAQALRKAFPEIGAQPTADELEGKTLDIDPEGNIIDGKTGEIVRPHIQKSLSRSEAAQPAAQPGAVEPVDANNTAGAAVSEPASPGMLKNIESKLKALADSKGLNLVDLKAECLTAHNLTTLDGISTTTGKAIQAWTKQKSS